MEEKNKGKHDEGKKEKLIRRKKKKLSHEKKVEPSLQSPNRSVSHHSVDNMVVVGRNLSEISSGESVIRLHSNPSLLAIPNECLRAELEGKELDLVASNSSFISAKSNVTDGEPKIVQNSEGMPTLQNTDVSNLQMKVKTREYPELSFVSGEPNMSLGNIKLQLKEMERILNLREKKIRYLQNKIEEYSKAKEKLVQENRGLTRQIGLLNRQLQSMYDMLGKKDWKNSVDPAEFARCKNRISELETMLSTQDETHQDLLRRMQMVTDSLQTKEKELFAKNKELIDYKNRSTLEVCRLINQIDCLQNEAKLQSQLLEAKIQEAQKSMDYEIVEITKRLEAQYQEDLKTAIEKFHTDFEKLSDLPRSAIEKLLKICEPEKIDLLKFQKDWDKQQAVLETKIQAMQSDHGKELLQVKDSYEGKILFLKTQIESLTSQLKERKEILDLFESELLTYKSNSSINLLKASSLGDDITSLKELYTTEIFSQKQVHKLQVDIFEEKVKTLTEEILFHAKNEEIYLQELENAKKMANAFREKYEQLVAEWEERVERDLRNPSEVTVAPELDGMFEEFKSLIQTLKKSESVHEERLKVLESQTDEERLAHLKEIEMFTMKLGQLEKFQKSQVELDEIIQEMIKSLGANYTKTLDALTTSHMKELSLKHLEFCTSKKRHVEEMDALKNTHEKEMEEMYTKIEKLQKCAEATESELGLKTQEEEALKQKLESLSLEVLKSEGMMAIKEETEQALTDRVRDLEQALKTKEENCKKELEDLAAKFIEIQVLSSAKDELAKELEDRLNESESMLEKSCKEVEKLQNVVSLLEENIEAERNFPNDGGDFTVSRETGENFEKAKIKTECLKVKITEMCDRVEHLEGLHQSSGDMVDLITDRKATLDCERSKIVEENQKLKLENCHLMEEIAKVQKTITELELKNNLLMEEHRTQLEVVETEKTELLLKKKMAEDEREEIQQRNEYLEENIQDLTNKMDSLLSELATFRGQKSEVFSISLQEVHVLYQEEQDTELDTGASSSTFGRQTSIDPKTDESIISLLKTNKDLKEENACLKMELMSKSRSSFYEEMIYKFKKIQKELLRVIKERDELMVINEAIRRERDYFKEETESLRENLSLRQGRLPEIEDAQHRSAEMKQEIEKLTEYVNVLSAKLDMMKTSNEILLSKSQEHLKHNQNLVNELEEAWSQRYEIEEQLTKVRKENALLNQHRDQLEETNRRISSLVAEGKPSVVSWIKIHETVENIVDEVLALKTSFSSSNLSGASTSVEVPKTTSELKMMTETLHIQLKNKTMLCDELIVQKETLERELKNLERLLRDTPKSTRRYVEESSYGSVAELDLANRQSRSCPLESQRVLEWNADYVNSEMAVRSENAQLAKLTRLKKHLEDQVKWEEAQFRENLELEIKGLSTQMQALEERLNALKLPSDDRELFEVRYEREVIEISLEFVREIEKLKNLFDSEKDDNSRERYAGEIDRLKIYFEKRWDDLKQRNGIAYNTVQVALDEDKDNNTKTMEEVQREYEAKLDEEKRKFSNALEEVKQKHEREMIALEEFWTEKLSECETKCALMKATGSRRGKNRGEHEESNKPEDGSKIEQVHSKEETKTEGNQSEKCRKDIEFLQSSKIDEEKPEESFCVSSLSNQPYFDKMEVTTDDDKLDIILQRNALKEMVASMEIIITKLLAFIGLRKGDLNNTIDLDDTMYKSIHLDPNTTDMSVVSNSRLSLDLSTIVQDLTENSLLNSSDQVRFELEKCMKQLQKDAKSILALSSSDKICLGEIMKKFEKEKNRLEGEVLKVEEMQKEMKKEIALTKERLNQWERNLEVVSEGYGEEVVKSKQMISLSDLKDKLKMFLADHCALPSEEMNLLEQICRESEMLQEEWKREKHDLQQQIDVADKQVHSLKKFLEEQATEREQEREAFDKEVNELRESLKARERDNSLQNRTNREVEREVDMLQADEAVEALEGQVKELTARLTESESNKAAIEGEFQNAVKKIWSLREIIQDLEVQLAEVSEKESKLKKKVEKLELLVEEQEKMNGELKQELDTCQNQKDLHYSDHIKALEEEVMQLRHIASQVNPDSLAQLNANLRHIESILMKKTKDLEQLHVSSANVSCSSPSEDVSIRDHFDATRCSTPDEMSVPQSITILPLEEIERVQEKLARHTRAEEVAMKYIQDLKMQLRHHQKALEEVQTERDILLEKIDVYLKDNSSLKVRLEEQRCNAGLLQKQLNANLESQIGRLETDVEKLRNLCDEKDKQLNDLKTMLENTSKSLRVRETEALNKSKEENKLITTLRTDLANALSENEKLEDTLEKMKEKLKESMTMPALMDSMLEEKNAEIDRLEKELLRLSSDKTSGVSTRSYSSDGKKRRIRFSEPDSFSDNISSISAHGSDMRNCSDSFGDFRNSSLKSRRPVTCSTKLESISSIAPLQLSPRGTDSPGILSWKTSSPLAYSLPETRSPSRSSTKSPSLQDDFQQMLQDSKLQSEIEAKQREISELNLEMDKLKRQIVEINQELATAKTQTKEVQNDLETKEEEVRKLKNNEKSLLMTIESLKKNHAEEVDELQKKLIFEREKVEKVYEEIKALEVKKIEIEESFLSLKEDYNEKVMTERKTAEILLERIKVLEVKNEESEVKLTALEKDMESAIKESEETVQKLSKEILKLKDENEKMQTEKRDKTDAETQVEVGQNDLIFEVPEVDSSENIDKLKLEFDKMTAMIGETNFNKAEAYAYAMTVKKLITTILDKLTELYKELEVHRKKLMECSVDELAVKVQKELLLSASLDNKLLSNIEANAGNSSHVDESAGGDTIRVRAFPETDMFKIYKEINKKMTDLENEKENLKMKIAEQQKVIRLLEESLKKEKERILEEKERCMEDAKIMELLRVNLEKGLRDIKAKEKELKKEKQQRMALEKEVEVLKRQGVRGWESKKVIELNAQLESQKEKIVSIGQLLEEERRKNQELIMSLEESRMERMSDKSALKLLETDFSLAKEQNDNLKKELTNARKLLNSRNVEIRLLKQKINLQDIDIKALTLSNDVHRQSGSETSSVDNATGNMGEFTLTPDMPSCILTKRLNSCLQRHVKDTSEVGNALLYLTKENDQIKKFEPKEIEPDIEKKLWALEKGSLILDIETLRGENDILKRDLLETCKSTELLRLENAQLKKEKSKDGPNQIEVEFLNDRVSHLTQKYLRTESHRKALAWQKNYLKIALKDYRRSEEEAWKRLAKKKRERKPKRSFKVVALAVISIFRMKFIVRKWRMNALGEVYNLLEKQKCKQKLTSLASILNIYNEPVNPLSYQTQNIFPQSSSRVLRTPPCRDPGPRSYSLDSKKKPDCFETFPYLPGTVGTARALP